MPQMLDTLAAAYAEAGRFDEAFKWISTAIKQTPLADKANLEVRLKLYKAGKTYREQR